MIGYKDICTNVVLPNRAQIFQLTMRVLIYTSSFALAYTHKEDYEWWSSETSHGDPNEYQKLLGWIVSLNWEPCESGAAGLATCYCMGFEFRECTAEVGESCRSLGMRTVVRRTQRNDSFSGHLSPTFQNFKFPTQRMRTTLWVLFTTTVVVAPSAKSWIRKIWHTFLQSWTIIYRTSRVRLPLR